eukprot:TRINITY_DN25034_c0_g1_i1.p1 TRINITY_DN25034_c0_g1~~TRINITY_DN25034_c0_g1_i1.p1  ORF type:complete len:107 (+),score=52.74 TRINITY_DN25034_c0_g1_i1:123-443(+)
MCIRDRYGKGYNYERFESEFNPVLYNATEWAEVFKQGGAKYVYMTAKHSDGFAMWPSSWRPHRNSVDTIGRDLLGELMGCLLYTSDAADDLLCVDLGGRRIIKKKN